ncbi:MAG: SUMF1/EgtB/PvdO family nonheme iron enzyme, partial [Pirellulaceae bacterium]
LAIVSHEGHPHLTQVQDRSGEVAFVVGLRALRRREGLDDNVAVTAQREGPLTTTASNGAVQVVFDATSRLSPGLLPVGGVAQKALAREMAPEMYQRRITRVIVAPGQAEAGESWDNGRLTFPVAVSLDGVYHHMARWARLTLTANRYLAAQAKRRLDTECDPYLRSTLSRRKQAEQSATRDVPDKDPYEQLDSRIVDQIVLGTCTRATLAASSEGEAAGGALRLALYADSGVGKSMFLVHCEHEIADRYSQPRVDGSNDPLRLPVRLTHLSGYSWHEPTKFWSEELPLLFMEPLREVLEEGADTIGEIRSWLEHLRGRAQLVFLLDALDQTKSVPDLHDWIDLKGGVSRCPVYITGRQFAIEHTRSAALPDRCMLLRLDKFHREQQEKFLGPDLARELLPQQRDDKGVRARKERWQDLLDVPLLLKYVRDLARDGTLPTLPNRERVYTQAIDRLIAKGLESHKATNEPPVKPEHARRWFAAAAWSMVEAENFTGVVSDRQYHRLMEDLKSRVGVPHEDILDRINVGRQELRSLAHGTATAFEWRHLSFCEYFAGTYLAEEREPEHVEQELSRILDMVAAVRRAQEARLSRNSDDTGDGVLLSPRDRWYWVFRFALSRAFARASTGDLGEREAFRNRTLLLARTLIASGHPHVVWDAIRADGVRLPNEWDQLCRWLVHQTWSWNVRDDREAWQSDQPPAILASTLHAIVTHLDRRYRNGSTLAAAWTLVEQALASRDEEVKAQASDIARSFLSPEATVDSADRESLRQLRESFRPCPGLNFDRGKARNMWRADDGKAWVFEMGASNLDGDAGPDEFPRHKMRIAPFEIMEFSVTNAAFEVLDPSHYFLRDRYSADDDQPATWVSWYTADLFARVWLPAQVIPSSSDSQPEPCWEYGLPTECEREFAARGGTGTVFWWGDKFGPEHCNALKIVITSRSFRVTGDALSVTGRVQWRTGRTLSLAETNKSGGYRNPFGLFHMGGNVFEWCADWYDANSYQARCKRLLGVSILRADAVALSGRLRVVRGGSFDRDRSRCRSSDRDSLDPIGCARNVGFRVCRRFGTPESSPDYVL